MSRRSQTRYYLAETPLPQGFIVVRDGRKPYSFWLFLFDLFMLALTCGLWIFWIIWRECRR